MNKCITFFLSVGLLVLVGCTGNVPSATPMQIPIAATVAPDESGSAVVESLVLLEVVLFPHEGGIDLQFDQGSFGLGFVDLQKQARVDLPEGYRLPQWIPFREVREGKSFQLLIGPGDLPVEPDRIVHLPLTEEIRVPITQEGLTQVLFDGELPSCGEE